MKSLEQLLKEAIKQEKENFQRLHATHQGYLAFLRRELKNVKRNSKGIDQAIEKAQRVRAG